MRLQGPDTPLEIPVTGNRTCGHAAGRCTLPEVVLPVACAKLRKRLQIQRAKKAAAEDGGLLVKLAFPRYSVRGLEHRATGAAMPFRKGAVTASKVSVKPQGSLGFGGSETQ